MRRYPALYYHDFRLLWSGQFASNIGTQMQFTALNWHIYVLTNSPFALGLIGLARFIPILFFSLFGGIIADTTNRKKLLFLTQAIAMLLAIVLTIATFTNHVTPFLIYLITILSTIVFSFDAPARQSFYPTLVDKKDLTNAISLNSIMFQTATIVGPGLAGFLIAHISIGSVYLINAFSFMAVLLSLYFMHSNGEIKGDKVSLSLNSLTQAIHFVCSKTLIWSTMLLDFFSTFFASATALLPVFAKDILHVGPQGYGILAAAPAIGALLTGFIMAHLKVMRRQGIILLTAVAFYGAGTIIFGSSRSLFLSFIGLFIIGAGDSISTIIRNVIRQLNTPDSMRGRMTGINMIFFMGGPQLGEFEAGILAAMLGGPYSVIIGGIGTLLAVGITALLIPTLRKFDYHTAIDTN